MEIYKLIKERRTIHNFSNKSVAEDLLLKSIELATYAPNHKKTKPWFFVKVGETNRKKLADLSLELKTQKTGEVISDVVREATRRKFLEPTYLLLVGIKKSNDRLQSQEDYASLACGLQNMALYLWDQGVGTKWSTGAVTRDAQTYKLAQLDAEKFELFGFMWIGYPKETPAAFERPAISEIMTEIP